MSDCAARPIGIFDSGVGGLSVLRHIRAQHPHERLLYVADQAHVPYGRRSLDEIRVLSEAVTRFLLEHDAKLVVVACNTASGAALTHLRRRFPDVPFVGMEPAVKPAAAQTRSGKVGILATTGTFESQRYSSLMARFAQGVEVYESPCLGLVEQIEAGLLEDVETADLLRECLEPMLAADIDTLVLGCTHYPFVQPLIQQLVGDSVAIIDPAPAVARQVGRLLGQQRLMSENSQQQDVTAYTTADLSRFDLQARRLLTFPVTTAAAQWQQGTLYTAGT